MSGPGPDDLLGRGSVVRRPKTKSDWWDRWEPSQTRAPVWDCHRTAPARPPNAPPQLIGIYGIHGVSGIVGVAKQWKPFGILFPWTLDSLGLKTAREPAEHASAGGLVGLRAAE